MKQLAVELQKYCIEALEDDRDALKSLRLTSKVLEQLATEVLFRRAILNYDKHSGTRFCSLVESRLNPCIRSVIFTPPHDPNNISHTTRDYQIEEFSEHALGHIPKLQRLNDVRVKFTADVDSVWKIWQTNFWDEPDLPPFSEPAPFSLAPWKLLLPVIRQAEGVKTLTICNIKDTGMWLSPRSDDFDVIVNRVTELHIETEGLGDDGVREYGFPRVWLKPANRQLTHLTIHGGLAWGIQPISDFRDVEPFPHLVSLSLGNFSIAHNWQIDWITAQSSLKRLYLSDCFIVTSLIVPKDMMNAHLFNLALPDHLSDHGDKFHAHVDLRWHEVFQRFRTELCLSHFVFGCSDVASQQAFENRYEISNHLYTRRYWTYNFENWGEWVFKRCVGYPCGKPDAAYSEEIVVPSPCDDEDEKAFQSLLEDVKGRKMREAQGQ